MRSATRLALTTISVTVALSAHGEGAAERILRAQVLKAGFKPAQHLYIKKDKDLVDIGKVIFASKRLSLNGNISCQTCHLDAFGSADGIPNAAAIHGTGEGPRRLLSGAKLLPRNTLPFWGRGAVGFETFFWDGKVDFRANRNVSQFGARPPSEDALVTAAHLPVVEIREMLDEDAFVEQSMRESVEGAQRIYRAIVENLRKHETATSRALAKELAKPEQNLTYTDYARALAAFIRSEFRIRTTRLERFVGATDSLSDREIAGGLVFYGKGRCVSCHTGPHFSDFNYHVVPFPQLGFGKNGFGVDYGRFNVTFNPADLYKFRTPPLFNVEKTSPYGHDGSVKTMKEAVIAHFDPLSLVDVHLMKPLDRHELYKRLVLSSTATSVGYLSEDDVDNLVLFLKTLSF